MIYIPATRPERAYEREEFQEKILPRITRDSTRDAPHRSGNSGR